ncbi:hypothetical protein A3A21_00390 [Candidatus Jorgensenbacteria bacterium RIFCSPLOWO2_01_FULL_45_25b]|uniref:Triosephosphate isomerase n=1 Tax=Candidatus Jorgensenbacteria bacterium RIFCSPLOWO2_01_FULL_45_25b TaxID=1798471 RepID=A0A1F6BUV2_9BACT|nr:MAG: hypothetical protein A3A21_00390 [Candidatus Jorgensenbacteria bacterium RIFCSPLOWO2_01_FULL_45_25b]
MKQQKLVVANWKMNPSTEMEAMELAKEVEKSSPSTSLRFAQEIEYSVVVCPPFPFLDVVGKILRKARLGSQDVFWENPPGGGGAYTGEVSVLQLKSVGVEYVIVGHSERRELGDTDEIVARKFQTVSEGGLIPILCVGEKKRELEVESCKLEAEKVFVKKQLESAFVKIKELELRVKERVVVAYEPVWAISSRSRGVSCAPDDVREMMCFIKEAFLQAQRITPLVLYGGSVNAGNARGFLELPEVDGVLVGSASLRLEEFKKIIEEAKF